MMARKRPRLNDRIPVHIQLAGGAGASPQPLHYSPFQQFAPNNFFSIPNPDANSNQLFLDAPFQNLTNIPIHNPNFEFQYDNIQPQNPNFQFPNTNFSPQNPNFQFPNANFPPQNPNFRVENASASQNDDETLERIDRVVVKARGDILASGDYVSAWKLSKEILPMFNADS